MNGKKFIVAFLLIAVAGYAAYALTRDRVPSRVGSRAADTNGSVSAQASAAFAPSIRQEKKTRPQGAQPLDLGIQGIVQAFHHTRRLETGEPLVLAVTLSWDTESELYIPDLLLLLDTDLNELSRFETTDSIMAQLVENGGPLLAVSAEDEFHMIRREQELVSGPLESEIRRGSAYLSVYAAASGEWRDTAALALPAPGPWGGDEQDPATKSFVRFGTIAGDGEALIPVTRRPDFLALMAQHEWPDLRSQLTPAQGQRLQQIDEHISSTNLLDMGRLSLETGMLQHAVRLDVQASREHHPGLVPSDGFFFPDSPKVAMIGHARRTEGFARDWYLVVMDYAANEILHREGSVSQILVPPMDALEEFLYGKPGDESHPPRIVQYPSGSVVLEEFDYMGLIGYHAGKRRLYLCPDPLIGPPLVDPDGTVAIRSWWHHETGSLPDDMPNLYYYDF